MKIHQPNTSAFPRLIALLPLGFGAFGLLLPGVSQGSLVLSILGGITVALGVATFFARSERFVDTRRRAVVSVKRWLWLHSETVLPLAHYDHVRVIANSDTNAQHDHTARFYEVNLVAKQAGSEFSGGFDTNVFLGHYPMNKEGWDEAVAFGGMVAGETGLPLRAQHYP
jgi:hypothetical protein